MDVILDTTSPRYAGFNVRMFANMIDMGAVALVSDDLINNITTRLFPQVDTASMIDSMQLSPTDGAPALISKAIEVMMQQQVLQIILFKNAMELLCIAIYTLPFWIYFASTPGKMLFGLSIRDARTFDRLSTRQCIERFLGYIVSFLPFAFGFLWIALNKRRRGFHDIVADTVVVRVPRSSFKPKRG